MGTCTPSAAAPIDRQWHIIDAKGQVLGRMASTRRASAAGQAQADLGAVSRSRRPRRHRQRRARCKLTGHKEEQKLYRYHSGYEGGLREERAKIVRQKNPVRLVEEAVRGMLPKTKLGNAMYRKLKVYATGRSSARRAETAERSRSRNLATTQYYGTGRRKTSTARVFLRPGTGTITVNKKPIEASFPTESLRLVIRQPLVLTETSERFDVLATTAGGGVAGQAGALRLGIARALVELRRRVAVARCARPAC